MNLEESCSVPLSGLWVYRYVCVDTKRAADLKLFYKTTKNYRAFLFLEVTYYMPDQTARGAIL